MKKGKKILGNSILVLIIVLIVGVLGYYFWKSGKSFVPSNFINARGQSAVIAANLVSNLDESVKSLDKISEQDRNNNYSEALNLVNQEVSRVEAARVASVDLSKQLIKMAESVQDIKPESASKLAFEAIEQETYLIQHVGQYDSYFASLLSSLKNKFVSNGSYNNTGEIQQFIENMNKEAITINSMNDAFNQKLRDFDKIVN